jgi:ATP-dependent helicase/nuclease subunit A
MSRPPVADQGERDRLVTELERTFFVEAGAGTGKTAAVVAAIIARVAAGGSPWRGWWRSPSPSPRPASCGCASARSWRRRPPVPRCEEERLRLAQAASEVDRARIETIHAFCSALLRMHPLEAGLPPDFETLADLAGDLDVRERFRRWFDSLTPGEPGRRGGAAGPLLGLAPDRLLDLFLALSEDWDVVEQATWPVGAVAAVDPARALGEDVQRCIDLLPLCHTPDDSSISTSTRCIWWWHGSGRQRPRMPRWSPCWRWRRCRSSAMRAPWPTGVSVDGTNACKVIRETMHAVAEEVARVLGAARTAAIGRIANELRDLVLAYAEERRQRGLVTYQDLLVRARNLLRDHPDVCAALRARWDLVAVDEFQDTDPLQAELAMRLCATVSGAEGEWRDLVPEPGRLCVVGDPKQSIYRFRRADIAVYSAVERTLVGADPRARVRLSVNFRSGRRIIEAVNTVFGGADGLMRDDPDSPGAQVEYVDLVAHAPEIEGSVRVVGDRSPGAPPRCGCVRPGQRPGPSSASSPRAGRWGRGRKAGRAPARRRHLHPHAQPDQSAQPRARAGGREPPVPAGERLADHRHPGGARPAQPPAVDRRPHRRGGPGRRVAQPGVRLQRQRAGGVEGVGGTLVLRAAGAR